VDPSHYLAGWAGLSELMDRGVSWSGHERNCVFLNRGGARFADVSALSGLDFDDDGRACLATDLDGDGDMDLVLKNRSGPQLRFVRNGIGSGNSLMLRLRDLTSGNGDAIGARVELVAGKRRLVRCVTAGDGYLGQQSRWLHFGLEGVPPVERVTVRWPDGSYGEFRASDWRGRFVAVRGTATLEPHPDTPRVPDADERPVPPLPAADTVVLREPLLLPPTLASVAFRGAPQRPVLLMLWSRSCSLCASEITALAARHEELKRAGLDIVLLGLHESSAQAKAALRFRKLIAPKRGSKGGADAVMRQRPASEAARLAFAAMLEAVLGIDTLTTPLAFLVDTRSRIQVVYVGETDVEALIGDTARFGLANIQGPLRTGRGGRWAFAVERSLVPLVGGLARRGLERDAAFFARLVSERRKLIKPPK